MMGFTPVSSGGRTNAVSSIQQVYAGILPDLLVPSP